MHAALSLRDFPATEEETAHLINSSEGVNRVVVQLWTDGPVASLRSIPSGLTTQRLARLRKADAIVRRLTEESGFDSQVWQFPVVLVPLVAESLLFVAKTIAPAMAATATMAAPINSAFGFFLPPSGGGADALPGVPGVGGIGDWGGAAIAAATAGTGGGGGGAGGAG